MGFEPNLAGLKDQRPHQKSNEPILLFLFPMCFLYRRSSSAGVINNLFKNCIQWTGRCSNPRLRLFRPALYRLSYQSVMRHEAEGMRLKEQRDRSSDSVLLKPPVSSLRPKSSYEKTRCHFCVTPGCQRYFVSGAECYLRCGCKGSVLAFCNAPRSSYP